MSKSSEFEEQKKHANFLFQKERAEILSKMEFPVESYHPKFKETVIKLLKFNNPINMRVMHERLVDSEGKDSGFIPTWQNMCGFMRPFLMPELSVCLEMIIRATPNELWSSESFSRNCKKNKYPYNAFEHDANVLRNFNWFAYPEIREIDNFMKTKWNEIDEEISKPIRDRINNQYKEKMILPIGQKIDFVQTSIVK